MTGWVRSSACAAGDCIEVKQVAGGGVLMRCTQFTKPRFFEQAEWDAFIAGVKAGDFDQLTGDTP